MARSIRFCRLLGIDVPETPDEGHIDSFLPGGVRFMLDSEQVIRSFHADWSRKSGNQLSLALECASPAEVDELYRGAASEGFVGELEPFDASWGQRFARLRIPTGTPSISVPRALRVRPPATGDGGARPAPGVGAGSRSSRRSLRPESGRSPTVLRKLFVSFQ